ncbi:hypothetical protein [Collinsella aerofaciens]|uniref:hypothetical protein n=1 Tax=Collinsella aerofaciens TaxID=74426 RepID=UPI001C02F5AA|nr:hypothetical protein [Collinsella aerofaciens]MBT9761501.1 hypothetical protein [Collinsella aerofaciens]
MNVLVYLKVDGELFLGIGTQTLGSTMSSSILSKLSDGVIFSMAFVLPGFGSYVSVLPFALPQPKRANEHVAMASAVMQGVPRRFMGASLP